MSDRGCIQVIWGCGVYKLWAVYTSEEQYNNKGNPGGYTIGKS